MRVQKNEQVITNIITKKTTMAIVSSLVGAISSHDVSGFTATHMRCAYHIKYSLMWLVHSNVYEVLQSSKCCNLE